MCPVILAATRLRSTKPGSAMAIGPFAMSSTEAIERFRLLFIEELERQGVIGEVTRLPVTTARASLLSRCAWIRWPIAAFIRSWSMNLPSTPSSVACFRTSPLGADGGISRSAAIAGPRAAYVRLYLLALLWHFRFGLSTEEPFTMGASKRRRSREDVQNCLSDRWHRGLWRRSPDSFFSVPLP